MKHEMNNQSAPQVKKSYSAPVLTEVGDVASLTLGAATGPNADTGASN